MMRKLMGQDVVVAGPELWFSTQATLAADKFPHEWEEIPIRSRAQWRAAQRIKSMIQFVERYRDEMDRQNEKAMQKNK